MNFKEPKMVETLYAQQKPNKVNYNALQSMSWSKQGNIAVNEQ